MSSAGSATSISIGLALNHSSRTARDHADESTLNAASKLRPAAARNAGSAATIASRLLASAAVKPINVAATNRPCTTISHLAGSAAASP